MESKNKITLKLKPKDEKQNFAEAKVRVSRKDKSYNIVQLGDYPSKMVANKRFAGKPCIICHGEIEIGQNISLCKDCKTPSHLECWQENNGCGVYGCRQSSQVDSSISTVQSEVQTSQNPIHKVNVELKPSARADLSISAGFWERLAAYLVDMIILLIPSMILELVMGMFGGVILGWLYFSIMESSDQQATVGKRVMKLIVVDINGDKVSFARATGRYFAKILSAIIFCIGFLMIAFTQKKQGLHDIIAECLVIRK